MHCARVEQRRKQEEEEEDGKEQGRSKWEKKKFYAAGGNRLVVMGQGECFASDDQMLARSTSCAARFNSACIHCVGGKCI